LGAARLSGADLGGALLEGADFEMAILNKHDDHRLDTSDLRTPLEGAYLKGAKGITNEGLKRQSRHDLEGVTMPDGQKY
jgi:uncharacterized protein YjbI with pentapeptide repeats